MIGRRERAQRPRVHAGEAGESSGMCGAAGGTRQLSTAATSKSPMDAREASTLESGPRYRWLSWIGCWFPKPKVGGSSPVGCANSFPQPSLHRTDRRCYCAKTAPMQGPRGRFQDVVTGERPDRDR